MTASGIQRFVGVSGMNVQVRGDARTTSNAVAAWLIRTMNRSAAGDKRAEYDIFAHSSLEWTLVRATRLVDGDETGRLEHDAHRSLRSSKVVRADLATFLVEVAYRRWYIRQAPFLATAQR
jgi:NAD(P)H-binding